MHDTHDAGAGPSEGVATELPNVGVRLVQVFTAPSALFDRLKERPVWIGAVVTIIVIGLVVQAFIPEQLVREMLLARLPGDASPDQVRATEQAAGVANVMRWVGTVAFPPVFFAVLAGFLLLIYNVLMGGEAAFKQLYSISAHANLIGAVGGLITLPLVLARNSLETVLSLHLLVPGLASETYGYRFLSGISLFGLWTTIVLGIGVSRVYPKVSTGGAVTLLLVAYVVVKALFAIGGGI
jgi:hypothetical protein